MRSAHLDRMAEVYLFTSWSSLRSGKSLRSRSRLVLSEPREISFRSPGRFLKLTNLRLHERAVSMQLRKPWVGSITGDAALDIVISGRHEGGLFTYHISMYYIDEPVFRADFAAERAWDFANLREEVFAEDRFVDQMKASFEIRIRQEKVLWYRDCYDPLDKPNPFLDFQAETHELRHKAELLFMESFAGCALGEESDYEIQAKIVEFLGTTGVCVIYPTCMTALINLGLKEPPTERLRKVLTRCMCKKTWLLKNIVLSGYYGYLEKAGAAGLSESAKAKFAYLQRFVDFVHSERPELQDLIYFFQPTADRQTLDEQMSEMCEDEEVLPVFYTQEFIESVKLDGRADDFRALLASEEYCSNPVPPEAAAAGDLLDFFEEPAPPQPGCWWRQKNDYAGRLAQALVRMAVAGEERHLLLDFQGESLRRTSELSELTHHFVSKTSEVQVSSLGTTTLLSKANKEEPGSSSLKLAGLKAIHRSGDCLFCFVLAEGIEEPSAAAKSARLRCCVVDIEGGQPLPAQLLGPSVLEVEAQPALLFAFDARSSTALVLGQYQDLQKQSRARLALCQLDGCMVASRQAEVLPLLRQAVTLDPAPETLAVLSVQLCGRLALLVLETEQAGAVRRRLVCCRLRRAADSNLLKPVSAVELSGWPDAQFFLVSHGGLPVVVQLVPQSHEYELVSARHGRLCRLRGLRRLACPHLSELGCFAASESGLVAVANTYTGVLARERLLVLRWRLKL